MGKSHPLEGHAPSWPRNIMDHQSARRRTRRRASLQFSCCIIAHLGVFCAVLAISNHKKLDKLQAGGCSSFVNFAGILASSSKTAYHCKLKANNP